MARSRTAASAISASATATRYSTHPLALAPRPLGVCFKGFGFLFRRHRLHRKLRFHSLASNCIPLGAATVPKSLTRPRKEYPN